MSSCNLRQVARRWAGLRAYEEIHLQWLCVIITIRCFVVLFPRNKGFLVMAETYSCQIRSRCPDWMTQDWTQFAVLARTVRVSWGVLTFNSRSFKFLFWILCVPLFPIFMPSLGLTPFSESRFGFSSSDYPGCLHSDRRTGENSS
jgi:hypothetical protein